MNLRIRRVILDPERTVIGLTLFRETNLPHLTFGTKLRFQNVIIAASLDIIFTRHIFKLDRDTLVLSI